MALSSSSPRWIVGDKPNLTGTIRADGKKATTGLLGVTVTITRAAGYLLTETFTSIDSIAKFNLVLPNELVRQDVGRILVAVLVDSSDIATIDTAITGTSTSVDITGTSPNSGYCKIDDEWMSFTVSGSTLTFTERGVFNTIAASHVINSALSFADVKETATPWLSYNVRDARQLATQYDADIL